MRRFDVATGSGRRPWTIALTLTCLALLGASGGPVLADESESEEPEDAAIALEVRGQRDAWLHGPSLSLAPAEGWLRPYVVGGGGLDSEVQRLAIPDPTGRFRDAPYAGRVGAGLRMQLAPSTSLALEGSTLVQPGPATPEPESLLGVRLELRF